MASRYTANVNAYVTGRTRSRIDALVVVAGQAGENLGLSDILREAIDAGLPAVERRLERLLVEHAAADRPVESYLLSGDGGVAE